MLYIFIGTLGDLETNITLTPCGCPQIKNIDECDCNYKYGRRGYECIYDHPNPLAGSCTKNDIEPYYCGEKCSR